MKNYDFFNNINSIRENTKIESKVINNTIIDNLVKINISSGPNMFPFDGWINYDSEDFSGFISDLHFDKVNDTSQYMKDLKRYVKNGGKINFIQHNIKNGLPQHQNESVDIIYLGQCVEHYNSFFELVPLLKECHRVMKSGAVLRIITPDLDLLINAYKNGQMDQFINEQPEMYRMLDDSGKLAMLMYGASGKDCTFDHYEGHMFLYTRKSITTFLNWAGFTNLKFYDKTGISHSSVLEKEVVDHGISHSFIVEAIK